MSSQLPIGIHDSDTQVPEGGHLFVGHFVGMRASDLIPDLTHVDYTDAQVDLIFGGKMK